MTRIFGQTRKESGAYHRANPSRRRLGTALAIVFLALNASACSVLVSSTPNNNAPPTDLTYSTNPASYIFGNAITPNTPQTSRSVTKYSVTPALPVGLAMDPVTGIISGTPTTITAGANYTILASNSFGSAFTQILIAIIDYPPTITFGGTTTLTYQVGTAISTISPTLGGGTTVSCASVPALPPGLSLDSSCNLTGTPTSPVPTPTDYMITATNSGGSAALDLNIAVNDIAPDFHYTSATFNLVRGTALTGGAVISTGGAITSCSPDVGLPAGITLGADCALSGTPTALASSAVYLITGSNSGGNFGVNITLQVTDLAPVLSYVPASYTFILGHTLTAVPPTNTGGFIASCAVVPGLPAGTILDSGCNLHGTPTALSVASPYTITATNSAGSSSFAVTLSVIDTPPTIAFTGSPYTFTHGTAITPTGVTHGGGAIVGCTSSPALPAGLSIAPTTCVISGTPTVSAASASYTITATNTGGNGTATITIKINAIAPILAYTGSPYSWDKNVTIAVLTPTNTGDATVSCSSTPSLPAGINLSPTCVISGTPNTIAATATYTISATNAIGTGTTPIVITVNDAAPVISFAGSPFVYTKSVGPITPISVISSGGAIVSCASVPTLPTGLALSAACGITGTPTAITATANYVVTATNAGGSGSATITVTVNDAAPIISYTGSPFTYAKGTAITNLNVNNTGGTITSCLSAPGLPAGLTLSSTCTLSGTPTAASPVTGYTITATNSGGNSAASISITVNDVAPSITYAGSPFTFAQNAAITSQTPVNPGGAITGCTSSPGLPAGLNLSPACVITGTPTTVSGATPYSVTATNSGGSNSVGISIAIANPLPVITYTNAPFTFIKGTVITSQTPTNSGGAITGCSVAPALPAGLALSAACVISGTPTAVDPVTVYNVTASSSGGSAPAVGVSITVNDVAPNISYTGSPFTYVKGTVITNPTLNSTGGTVVTCSSSPTLPAGLSISPTCTISGTPTVLTANTSFTITATNSGGASAASISIAVIDVAPVIAYAGSPFTFAQNTAITAQTPTNTGGTITSCSSTPGLPAGLNLSATCVMSGVPTVVSGTTSYTLTATNSGGSGSVGITIAVANPLPVISYANTPFTFTKGTAITSQTPSNSGGAITGCSVAPGLPAGLALSAACLLSGTPTAVAGVTLYTVTATSSGGNGSTNISITVNDVIPNISYAGSPLTYVTGTAITALTATNSGGTVVSCSSTPALPAGLSIGANCTISGTPTVVSDSTSYTITAINSGGTSAASISIAVNGVTPVIAYAGSPFSFAQNAAVTAQTPTNTGGTITSCSSSPGLPAGLNLSATCVITGTPTVVSGATSYTITGTNSGGSGSIGISIAIADPFPALVYTNAPFTFVKGTPITSQTPTNSGGAITACSVAPGLPAGLALSASCVLSGTPTAVVAGATYNVTASSSGGAAPAVGINITVNDVTPSISYVGSPFSYVKGTAITNLSVVNGGGAITGCSSVPSLPAGLAISATCTISGTPTAVAASTSYTITATNSGGSSGVSISIAVNDVAPVIAYAGSPFTFAQNAAITAQTPTNTGGTITSCSSNPALPAGLSLSTACVLSGTPTVVTGATSYTIAATNSGGTGSIGISIAIANPLPVIAYTGAPFTFIHNGSAITSQTPTNTGGAITGCSVAPGLPAGLALSAACVLSGTPTAATASGTYNVTATSSGGSAPAVGIGITVNDVAPSITYAGSPFSYTKGTAITNLTVVNGGGTITGCTSVPTLPAGLAISATCTISGTPTSVAASASYTITATNSGGSSGVSISIAVNDVAPVIAYAGSPFTFAQNSAITAQTPTDTGGAITSCTPSPALPAGLSLSTACVISGTPTVVSGTTSYTIAATNSGGTGSVGITIAVANPLPVIAYTSAPFTFVKGTIITSQTPSNSGGAITGCSVAPGLPAGLALSSACVLSGTPTAVTAVGTYNITATSTGGSAPAVGISITVNDVAPSISYVGSPFTYPKGTAITNLTVVNGGGTITGCASVPSLPGGLAISATCTISGTPTAVAASASYTITATNSGGSSGVSISIAVNDVAPVIGYAGSPFTLTNGSAIATQTPTNTGGAITSCGSVPGLPAGLALSSACVITGTPTATSGATNYTVTATNSGGSSAISISITVNSAVPVIAYTNAPFTFTKGTVIASQTPINTGGAINSCAPSPALPAGLSLSAACVISGTPTAITATGSYTITATNVPGNGTVNISITVNDVAPAISYAGSPFTFTKGTAIASQTPVNSGGPITSCSTNPTLPAGLSLSAACVISGTPTAVISAATYTITATNTGGSSPVDISIAVNDTKPVIAYAGSPFTFTNGTAIVAQTPTNTGGAITSCSVSPALPGGLALSSACVLSGTPTTVTAVASYTITATNTGGSGTATASITINDVAPTIAFAGSPFTFTVGTTIATQTPTNTGGAVTSCASAPTLPAGLSLSATCVITGTPTVPSVNTAYVVTGTNSGGTSGPTIHITVNNVKPTISYSGSPFTFVNGTAISAQTPTNTGGATTSCGSAPALPSGLSLSTTCVISGTPTAVSGSTAYTISATNAIGTGTASINITVNDSAPAITFTPSSVVEVIRTAISTITPINTGGAITSCATAPAMAAGLSLSTACVITGTPTATQASTAYTITATNSGGTSNATINIQVKLQPTLLFHSLTHLTAGTWNGAAALANNIWSTSWDGVTLSMLTNNNTAGLDSQNGSWGPTGSNVSFNSKMKIGANTAQSYNIWTATSTGASQTNLTGNYSAATYNADVDSVISPDGTKIAFASKAAINGSNNGTASLSYNIFVVATGGGTPLALTQNTITGVSSTNPVWSPDSTMIYFGSLQGLATTSVAWNKALNNSQNIWRINATGTGLIALTSDNTAGINSELPAVSPSGGTVAFASMEKIGGVTPTSFNIWTMNNDGSGKAALTSNTAGSLGSINPKWSPDGTEIVFQSLMNVSGTATTSYNIWLMSSTGASQVALTTNTAGSLDSQMPNFSPDNSEIAFYSLQKIGATTPTSSNIWIMKSNGTAQTAITQNTNAGLSSLLGAFNVWYAP